MGYKNRDVEVIPLEGEQYLVIACDSCGAIGSKEYDIIQVPPSLVGHLTCRVALLEVLSVGAHITAATVAISSEPFPTGEKILEGVREELKLYREISIPIAVSTEKNIPTKQTSVGITIVGICKKHELRIGLSKPGDEVYCVGIPKMGHEITGADDLHMLQCSHIHILLAIPNVHDILPVGSQGILKEAQNLGTAIGSSFIAGHYGDLDVNKSAGPSTCAIFTCSHEISIPNFHCIPLQKIGKIK